MADEVFINYKDVNIQRYEHIVLNKVSFKIRKGEFVYLIGKVGSGKSSLLKSMYKEIPITDGEAVVLDYDLLSMKKKYIPSLRQRIGIVFQDFQLLNDRSVDKNLRFVLNAIGWKDKGAISSRIEEVLETVGMKNKGYKMPHELSGGEQQRIVIARSILNSPDIILADEPTGNLDTDTGDEILRMLNDFSKKGSTVIVSTHNLSHLEKTPGRVLKCINGSLVE